MKKKLVALGFITVLLTAAFPFAASADMGPKPSVVVDFEGFSGQAYYVTLLSSRSSTVVHSVLKDGEEPRFSMSDEEYLVFQKFVEYQDSDGYYFLQKFQNCSSTQQFVWQSYPPSEFKILVYFSGSDRFAVSAQAYSSYAFDSYYKVSLTEAEVSAMLSSDEPITFTAKKNYNYAGEILSLLIRMALTIGIELFIAIGFSYTRDKQFAFIVAVNLLTQIALNVVLNIVNYNQGILMFYIYYIALEFFVFIIEAVLYIVFLRRLSDRREPMWRVVVYTLVANTVSFGVGFFLTFVIPVAA